ncbi:MAG: hypothetical protein DME31_07465, partial [Verrucomicrobia bacterium]
PDWGVRLGIIRKSYGRRIAQMATSESRMNALQRKWALKEGLICFFTSRYAAHILGRIPLLPRNAKLRQDFFAKCWKSMSQHSVSGSGQATGSMQTLRVKTRSMYALRRGFSPKAFGLK